MDRILDLFLSILGLLTLSPFILFLFIVCWLDTGSPFFIQSRVGQNQKLFKLYKFRTMEIGTASLPTHLVDQSKITKLGYFLRCYKLDELPQLWNVLKGEMSVVGPRPCLLSQTVLIRERERLEVFTAKPGMTGVAQIKNVDMSSPKALARLDAQMLNEAKITLYLKIIFITILHIFRKR
jgi:O-antigen biosynthesis protein WbqP